MSFGFYNSLAKSDSMNHMNTFGMRSNSISCSPSIASSSYDSFTMKPKSITRKLKSSLKISSRNNSVSSSLSSASSVSSASSNKSVRFAPELTTVKKFCSSDRPSFISAESSPNLVPLDESYQSMVYTRDDYDDNETNFAFNQKISQPFLPRNISIANKGDNGITNFQLDYDSDSSLDDDDFSYNLSQRMHVDSDSPINSYGNEDKNIIVESGISTSKAQELSAGSISNNRRACPGCDSKKRDSMDTFDVVDWRLMSTNVHSSRSDNNGNKPNDICVLQNSGQNILLHSVKQIRDFQSNKRTDEIVGSIYVKNITFEKFIEIKFTFTNWSDIHYVTATYRRSITDQIDEFVFKINLSSFKYFLKLDDLLFSTTDSNLLTNCPLKIELCCRYDVNNETYYDNNNYKNYELSIMARTQNLVPTARFNPIYLTKEHIANTEAGLNNNGSDNRKPASPKRRHHQRTLTNRPSKKSFYSDFLVSTTLSHKIHLMNNFKSDDRNAKKSVPLVSRRFSEDTDYYNTSPLKHLYHNDTTPITPTSLNRVLQPSTQLDSTIEGTNAQGNMAIDEDGNPFSPPQNGVDDSPPDWAKRTLSYPGTPSLSSSVSSSMSDIPQLDEYTDFFGTGAIDESQVKYNPNYNFADSFAKGFNNNGAGSDSDGTDGVGTIRNEDDYEHVDPLIIADSNNDFSDDRQSIVTETPQNFYSDRLFADNHDDEEGFMNFNNNSNETLIRDCKTDGCHSKETLIRGDSGGESEEDAEDIAEDTMSPQPQISSKRSENAENTLLVPSRSSSSSSTSSDSTSFLSASNDLDDRRCSNLSSRVADTIATSALSGSTEAIKPHSMDYQTLLNSYCFYSSDTTPTMNRKVFEMKAEGERANPIKWNLSDEPFALPRSESPSTSQMLSS